MAENTFVIGQRWISNSEAELGLGIVKEIFGRQVELSFPAASEHRIYAAESAPLSRVQYAVGEQVKTDEDVSFTITACNEFNGCLFYQGVDDAGNELSIHELDLNSFVQFGQASDRLLAGQVDKNSQFELRTEALAHQHRLQQSTIFGLMGARVQLLPHQLYIADQVSQRHAPRVLLADEVGLGKTIEAGLIIHQQVLTGRANRVLIIVSDSLVHQWLVEMLRRFNLHFTVMDEDRHHALLEAGEGNPFESAQLVLCHLSLLTSNPEIYQHCRQADWDLMIVDEAHHLQWNETAASVEYQCIEGLAQHIAGLLLLTATPEQLGVESHFARLRLLDPDRYYDLAHFRKQEADYQPISDLIHQLLAAEAQDKIEEYQTDIEQYLGQERYLALQQSDDFNTLRDQLVRDLLDQHGTGRILFRNTRDVVSGFPQRELHTYPLTAPEQYLTQQTTADTPSLIQAECLLTDDWLNLDSRVTWLAEFLSAHRGNKVLVICANAQTAQDLEQYLRLKLGLRSSVFHEGLSLINRDRAAAYFADDEQGAQVMICSEIGSEGRNFQFSHHLVLFDLPLNPDLLEQRIGRLDRIGQQHHVQLHVPYYQDTAQAVLLAWYDQGMNAFSQVFPAGSVIQSALAKQLDDCLHNVADTHKVKQLIEQTQALSNETLTKLQQGRNRLLELNSCNSTIANQIIEDIEQASQTRELAHFMDKVFDAFGLEQQHHSANSVILKPSAEHQFPAISEEGLTATYDRHRALIREDMHFLTWEHPIVMGGFDLTLNSDFGNTAFCTLATEQFAAGTLLLEAIFTFNCPAPKSMQIGRYFDQSYLRLLVDDKGNDFSEQVSIQDFNNMAGQITKPIAQELIQHAKQQISHLVSQAEKVASSYQQAMINSAINIMQQTLTSEQRRLVALAKVNDAIRDDEIDYISQRQKQLTYYLESAKLRLDAVRVAIVVEL